MFTFLYLACSGSNIDTALPLLEEEYRPIVAKVTWENDQLLLSISGPIRSADNTEEGVGKDYFFGIIESKGADGPCEENSYGCWTGEDCSGEDFIRQNDTPIPNKCHIASVDPNTDDYETDTRTIGQKISYSVGIEYFLSNPDNSVNKTAFPSPNTEKYEFRVSYFLKDSETGKCWAWGVNPDYFNDQNCDYPSRYQGYSAGSNAVILE